MTRSAYLDAKHLLAVSLKILLKILAVSFLWVQNKQNNLFVSRSCTKIGERKDENGNITREEMAQVDENILPRRLMDSACVGSILDFFDFLDVDEKGELLGWKAYQKELEDTKRKGSCLVLLPFVGIPSLKSDWS